MFGPKNNLPFTSIDHKNKEFSPVKFTRTLADTRYHQNDTGRDSYIYDNCGGFTCTNVVQSKPLHQSGSMQKHVDRT